MVIYYIRIKKQLPYHHSRVEHILKCVLYSVSFLETQENLLKPNH